MENQGYSPITLHNEQSGASLQSERTDEETPSESGEAPLEGTSQSAKESSIGSTEIRPSFWILILTIFYTILVLSAWTITCILSYRPITTAVYIPDDIDDEFAADVDLSLAVFKRNERWYRAARVIQSIAAVLTVPLTSAVCSNAAVLFIQRCGKSSNLTLRKLLALADKGWTSAELYLQLIKNPANCWNRYFSSFLVMAITLHILGALISPLQALLLAPQTIKVPHDQSSIILGYLFLGKTEDSPGSSLGEIAKYALPALRSATGTQYNERTWQANSSIFKSGQCGSGTQLSAYTGLVDPFIVGLPNSFSTGLTRQWAPRLNTSVQTYFIDNSSALSDCKASPSFQRNYNGAGWAIEICVPVLRDGNRWKSPWRQTNDRQDISEELLLQFNFTDPFDQSHDVVTEHYSSFLKVTANTTAGLFELPNYSNKNKPGPLEDKDPGIKHSEAQSQFWWLDFNVLPSQDFGGSVNIEDLAAPGPLLALTYATFGANDSYMSICSGALNSDAISSDPALKNVEFCSDAPLMHLLNHENLCGRTNDSQITHNDVYGGYTASAYGPDWDSLTGWLSSMGARQKNMSRVQEAFNIGLALVNTAWTEVASYGYGSNGIDLTINLGADTQIPKISRASIIGISVLIAVYLSSLLSVATYAVLFPRWTDSMNGFTMMRIGASVADKVPLSITYQENKISILDKIPGWIGAQELNPHREPDETGEKCDGVHELGLGFPLRLRERQRYTCYQPDRA